MTNNNLLFIRTHVCRRTTHWLDEKPDARAVVDMSLVAEGRVTADPLEIVPEFMLYNMPAMAAPNYSNVAREVDSRFLQYQIKIENAFVRISRSS